MVDQCPGSLSEPIQYSALIIHGQQWRWNSSQKMDGRLRGRAKSANTKGDTSQSEETTLKWHFKQKEIKKMQSFGGVIFSSS